MLKLDFDKFCRHHKIKNKTQRDWIHIYCPFCHGSGGDYLGFNPTSQAFYCWKCGKHTKYEVVTELSDLPWTEIKAKFFTKNGKPVKINKPEYHNTVCELPPLETQLTKQARQYLKSRNFNPDYLHTKYQIQSTKTHSNTPHRLFIPLLIEGEIISYTMRDVTGQSDLRYISCNPEKEVIPIKDCLYNLDNCNKDFVIVVEGCFDCWRIGDNCVATMGTKVKESQINLLRKFKKIYLLFDRGAEKEAAKLAGKLLLFSKVEIITIDSEDPAEMCKRELKELLNYIK